MFKSIVTSLMVWYCIITIMAIVWYLSISFIMFEFTELDFQDIWIPIRILFVVFIFFGIIDYITTNY